MASNYGEGDYPVYRILADGSIGAETDDVHGSGSGPDADRQEGPHAHQILTDPDARHVFGVDLGADKVFAWTLDPATGRLVANAPTLAVPPGSGPRHLVFHPSGRFAYVLNELSGTIATLRYDSARGSLQPSESVSTLPADFVGSKSTAEIRIHPSGRFLYSTNRGHNSVAMFVVDQTTGTPHPIGWEPTRGEWPRGMNIDPSGMAAVNCCSLNFWRKACLVAQKRSRICGSFDVYLMLISFGITVTSPFTLAMASPA